MREIKICSKYHWFAGIAYEQNSNRNKPQNRMRRRTCKPNLRGQLVLVSLLQQVRFELENTQKSKQLDKPGRQSHFC